MKSIFVSHVFEDQHYLNKMKTWETKGRIEGYTFTFEVDDKRIKGREEIKNILTKKFNGCTILLVLIGDNTHNHDWIKSEVELAKKFNKKIYCVRIPGTTGGRPKILINYIELVFNPNQIIKVLDGKK